MFDKCNEAGISGWEENGAPPLFWVVGEASVGSWRVRGRRLAPRVCYLDGCHRTWVCGTVRRYPEGSAAP